MHVSVVADPQVDRLLAPADYAVKFALQIEHQAVDKMQIVVRQRRILDTQQIRLQLVPCGFQRILELTQSAGGF